MRLSTTLEFVTRISASMRKRSRRFAKQPKLIRKNPWRIISWDWHYWVNPIMPIPTDNAPRVLSDQFRLLCETPAPLPHTCRYSRNKLQGCRKPHSCRASTPLPSLALQSPEYQISFPPGNCSPALDTLPPCSDRA